MDSQVPKQQSLMEKAHAIVKKFHEVVPPSLMNDETFAKFIELEQILTILTRLVN